MSDDLLVLAVDVGSSAVRAALIGASGHIAASHRVPRPDSASGLTFDPRLLWAQVSAAVQALPATERAGVQAMAIAGHIGTVFADAGLEPVGAGMGWADSSGVEALASAYAALGPDTLAEIGRVTVTGGAAAASLSLRTRDARGFASVRHILSPKDYLVACLTGVAATDFTSAAYSALSSVRDREWSERLLNALDLDPALFPPQLASTDVVGQLSASMALALGLPNATPVIGGGPDGTVGAIFVAGDRGDVIADIAGTTDVLVRPIAQPDAAPAGAIVNPYPLGGWSAGGPTGMTGGALARWSNLLGAGSPAQAMAALGDEIAEMGPGSEGLRIRPTLSGSRFPRWVPAETGLVAGQLDSHGAAHFLRAAAEGAAYVVREGIDLLAADERVEVLLAGGAARSALLAQLRADVLNRPVQVCREPDVSLMGAGLLAMLGCGIHSSVSSAMAAMADETIRLEPNPAAAGRYEDLYIEWRTHMRSWGAKE